MLAMQRDDVVIQEYAESATDDPIVCRTDPPRNIYESQRFSQTKNLGLPVLIDFGEARHGKQAYRDPVQPNLYRAPEVLLQMEWDEKIDIWSVGMLVSVIRSSVCINNTDEQRHGTFSKVCLSSLPRMRMVIFHSNIISLN